MTTFEKVQNILVEQLEVEATEVTLATKIVDDLSADSLDFVEIGMSIEEEFDVEVEESEYKTITTVNDLVTLVDSKL